MIQIVIHCLPHEIDQLEQTLIRLKYNSTQLEETKILVDVLLNLNLVEWETSQIPKSFFINKFHQLEQLTKSWAETKFEINEDGMIQGCVSHRRKSLNETQADALLFLDTDIFFESDFLYYLSLAFNTIKETQEYFILTPQITPMWDGSWDVLVNDNFKDDGIHFQQRDPYIRVFKSFPNIKINQISEFKFGGGWATLISTPLAKKIGIPESLGHYGLEDTFIMYCSIMMKQHGIKVDQFVLNDVIIIEDHLYRFNPYKEFLTVINKQEEFKKIANENFSKEIIKFGESLKN